MGRQKNIINFDRFLNPKIILKDISIVFSFLIVFLIVCSIENNLFLPDNGLGLLQHRNIWLFLLINISIPILLILIFKYLYNNLSQEYWNGLKNEFRKTSESNFVTLLQTLLTTIGLCCFAGNTMQNANLINILSFDYWDGIHYPISYFTSRLYKLYLFAYFMPTVLIYVFILIKSVSKLLEIPEDKMDEYPIENYGQLNILCNLGLNILLVMSISLMLLAGNIYTIHHRWDITTITSIIISFISSTVFLGMYLYLIKNYRASMIKYKKRKLEQIDVELAKINGYIIDSNPKLDNDLDIFIKKGKYLWKIKKKINNMSCFPYKIKGLFVSISPLAPTLLKTIFQLLNTFFKTLKLDTIL